jgi:hypothetical protein
MKKQFLAAGVIAMALAACEGDVRTSATGPGAAYCEAVCSCESCSNAEVESCSEDIKSLSDQAGEKGCDAPFESYLGCLESLPCDEGLIDDSACSTDYVALSQCMGPTPTCATAGDGTCDEPEGTGTCPEGSDAADCGGPPPPCATMNDGICDEPEGTGTCDEGSDAADCGEPPPPCQSTNNGVCDEPEGSNTCPEGSDVADCSGGGSDCDTYCAMIAASCTGQNQQYASTATCLATCAALPPGMPADLTGNSVGCRTYHATAAKMDPDTHCVHAGPSGDGVCGDPCESFCTIVQAACTGGSAVYPTAKECMFECTMFPNSEPYDASDTAGDSLACRLYHATVASQDPVTHCPHVTEASATCK